MNDTVRNPPEALEQPVTDPVAEVQKHSGPLAGKVCNKEEYDQIQAMGKKVGYLLEV